MTPYNAPTRPDDAWLTAANALWDEARPREYTEAPDDD